MRSFLYRAPGATEPRWSELARRRMRADYLRVTASLPPDDLGETYAALLEAYDRGSMPWERALVRLSYARWLLAHGQVGPAREINAVTLELTRRHDMRILEADAWSIAGALGDGRQEKAAQEEARLRRKAGYQGASRP